MIREQEKHLIFHNWEECYQGCSRYFFRENSSKSKVMFFNQQRNPHKTCLLPIIYFFQFSSCFPKTAVSIVAAFFSLNHLYTFLLWFPILKISLMNLHIFCNIKKKYWIGFGVWSFPSSQNDGLAGKCEFCANPLLSLYIHFICHYCQYCSFWHSVDERQLI